MPLSQYCSVVQHVVELSLMIYPNHRFGPQLDDVMILSKSLI